MNETAIETQQNLKHFIGQWNTYIGSQNRLNFWRSLISAIAYLISSLMSFLAIGSDNIKAAAKYLHTNYSTSKAYIERFVRVTIKNRYGKDNKNKSQVATKADK